MPLDPSIILGVKPLNLATPDPIERFAKLTGVEQAIGQLQDQRQAREDERAVREAYQQSGGDSATLRRLLTERGSYKQIQALDKADYERRQAESTISRNTAQAGKANWEIDRDKLQHGAAMLDFAKDAQSFEQVLRLGQINGTFKPEFVAQVLAQGYSPQLVEQLKSAGLTRAQQLENENRVATRAQTAATAPFTAGPGGVPVPNVAVQDYERSLKPGATPHYDTERGIVVDPRTGVGTPITVGGQPVGGKPDKDEAQRRRDAQAVVDIARQALPLLDKAHGSYSGTAMGVLGQVFGVTSAEQQADAQLKVLAGALVSKMPKMSGPQSDRDVQLYREMAGELGDSTKPIATRKAALRELLRLQKTYGVDVPDELLTDKPKPTGRGAAPAPSGATPGGGASMRVTPETQNARDDEAARIRARQPAQEIESDIASIETALKNTKLDGTQRGILTTELNLLKRARELQRSGGRTGSVNPANLSDAELTRELNRTP